MSDILILLSDNFKKHRKCIIFDMILIELDLHATSWKTEMGIIGGSDLPADAQGLYDRLTDSLLHKGCVYKILKIKPDNAALS